MSVAPLLILLVLPVLIERFSRQVARSDRGAHGRDVGHHHPPPPPPAPEPEPVA